MEQQKSMELLECFPDIFDNGLLAGGIQCQDGWFDLLHDFALRVRRHRQEGDLGFFLIREITVTEGRLSIIHEGDAFLSSLVRQAEETSTTVCELDGQPAEGLYGCRPHWYRYLCSRCARLHELMVVERVAPPVWTHRHGDGLVVAPDVAAA